MVPFNLDKTRKPEWDQKKHFLSKNWILFFWKMSPSAEKCERGTLWDLLTYIQFKISKKIEGGGTKFRKKVAQCRKNRKDYLLVSSGFVGYLKKRKIKKGTLCTKFALAGHGLNGFRNTLQKYRVNGMTGLGHYKVDQLV